MSVWGRRTPAPICIFPEVEGPGRALPNKHMGTTPIHQTEQAFTISAGALVTLRVTYLLTSWDPSIPGGQNDEGY